MKPYIMMEQALPEEDSYINEQGYVVFTASYLLKRGECCGNGCKHCPYYYIKVAEPLRSKLLAAVQTTK